MRRLALVAFCLGLFFAGAPSANASDRSRFNRLVVFGDSLSDNGNSLFLFDVPQPPTTMVAIVTARTGWIIFHSLLIILSTVIAYFPNPENDWHELCRWRLDICRSSRIRTYRFSSSDPLPTWPALAESLRRRLLCYLDRGERFQRRMSARRTCSKYSRRDHPAPRGGRKNLHCDQRP